MARVQIYLKVVVDLEEDDEKPERIAREIARQVEKVYGVRDAEVTSIVES